MNELMRSQLNHEITSILATDKTGAKMWMRCNPATGTMMFIVADGGRPVCETLSLEKAAFADMRPPHLQALFLVSKALKKAERL